jgi:plastocyanin
MDSKKLASILALMLAVCISTPHAVRAGSPSPTSPAATVRGNVRFEGKIPVAKAISMAADPECAKQHSTPVMAQEVLTDAKGDLQNVIVFVSEGLGDRTFDAPTQPVVVEQKGCLYQPHVLAVRANQTLQLVNDDPTSHNIHPVPANNREWNKAEPPGSKMEEAFAREEIAIPVKCNVHPWMRGYIAKHPLRRVRTEVLTLPPGT